jgi:hypothetical protein
VASAGTAIGLGEVEVRRAVVDRHADVSGVGAIDVGAEDRVDLEHLAACGCVAKCCGKRSGHGISGRAAGNRGWSLEVWSSH